MTAVDLKLQEFAFVFEAAETTGGTFAFQVENVGQQARQIVIEQVPAGLDLEQAAQAFVTGVEPEGTEEVGFLAALPPGAKHTVVFTEALSPGRYALLCFLPDENDPAATPHALKGMVADFTVE